MEPFTDEIAARVRGANPGTHIEHVQHDKLPEWCIVRSPTTAEWDIYQNLLTDKKPAEANEMLVGSCVLYPDKEGLRKQLATHPALRETWAGEICEVAGITRGAKRKKL